MLKQQSSPRDGADFFIRHWVTDPEAAAAPKTVLMGDSVLDNFVWLKDPSRNLRQVLQQRLGPKHRCVNLAVDETTTWNFVARNPRLAPWHGYQRDRALAFPVPSHPDRYYFPSAEDGFMRQPGKLAMLSHVKHVVLSVGGNDLYLGHELQREMALSLLPTQRWRRLYQAVKLGERLSKCILAVGTALDLGHNQVARLTLVIPYHPHYRFNLLEVGGWLGTLLNVVQRALLSSLVTPAVQEMLCVAEENGCDVIDLSKTFDPTNEQHYGTGNRSARNSLGRRWSGAEPSNLTTEWITDLIQAVAKDPSGSSRVYWLASDGTRLERRENDWAFRSSYEFGPAPGRLIQLFERVLLAVLILVMVGALVVTVRAGF